MNLIDFMPNWWAVYIKWNDGVIVPYAAFPSHGQARQLSNDLKARGFSKGDSEVYICRVSELLIRSN